jgi:uncharacterized protein
MAASERIFIGVGRLVIAIPGARSLKDRRQAVRSLTDRLRHRFSVSVHEVGEDDRPGQQVLIVTSAGNDGALVRSILDQVVGVAAGHPRGLLHQVDVDVFRWHPAQSHWRDLAADAPETKE